MDESYFNEEKSRLIIDSKYENDLDIEGFSRMMNHPTLCYKFYWLEAIVQLISQGKEAVSYDEIINEMIANAWYSVLEFHIHLSGITHDGKVVDSLEHAVKNLYQLSNLPSNASKTEIKNEIVCYEKELHDFKMTLTQNVPYKALSGFANKSGEKINLGASAGRMMAYYNQLSHKDILLPYTFGEELGLKRKLHFSKEWMTMIQDHTVSILGWIQYEKVKWLQNMNPEVPGLVYKLAPLDEKMRKLQKVRKLWEGVLDLEPVIDVFKNTQINVEEYDVDHFIPWSFVMNDELWNLMPMDASLNSSKSNKLPRWDEFFDPFTQNQYTMYQLVQKNSQIHKLFEACYRDNLHSIWASQELYIPGNSKEVFSTVLEKNMRPVYDSARRQGYEVWRY